MSNDEKVKRHFKLNATFNESVSYSETKFKFHKSASGISFPNKARMMSKKKYRKPRENDI